ncbi:MAG: FAD-dependent oxidoreductase [Planctomycetota bacterium]
MGGRITGLAAARTLADHNSEVVVLDKGRGPGGRASTRWRDGPVFDHGAQYSTARDPRFGRVVESWLERGLVAAGALSLASIDRLGEVRMNVSSDTRTSARRAKAVSGAHERDAGPTGEVRHGRRAKWIERIDAGWSVACDDGARLDGFDAMIVAVPAPQALELIAGVLPLAEEIRQESMAPCWAAMCAFGSRLPIEADGLFVNLDTHALSWAIRDSSKPGRPEGEPWVLHATDSWMREHLELDRGEVAARLQAVLSSAVGETLPEPEHASVHRWLYELGSLDPAPEILFDRQRGLVLVGDWCAAGRIEARTSAVLRRRGVCSGTWCTRRSRSVRGVLGRRHCSGIDAGTSVSRGLAESTRRDRRRAARRPAAGWWHRSRAESTVGV